MTPPAPGVTAAAAAIAASPLLAAWTASLVSDEHDRWWRLRRVSLLRWLVVAVVATVFAVAGSHGAPSLAWWLLAVNGAVLAVVDSETYRLPARLVGPLAGAEAVTLTVMAVVLDEPQRLVRALLAAAAVAGVYFLIVLISPPTMGMGDVYVAGITSGLLGWASWSHVLVGQVIIWLLGPVVMTAVAIARPRSRSMKMHVPMGPALLAGALVACWL
jgi:leader peptidase (prepilin peptidase)/N-methyltransferase